jgi:hypothetical protein
VPPFKLYVNPLPPEADAVILPLLLVPVGLVEVAVTEMVTPVHGLLGAGLPPPLQEINKIEIITGEKSW